MRLRDGTLRQKALFAALVALFILGVGVAVADKLGRLGRPNVGWMIDRGYVSPTRRDASEAGLRGGGRALYVNGVPVEPTARARGPGEGAQTAIGSANTLTFETPAGDASTVTVIVRPWQWRDVVFTEGATDVIAVLFFVVGVTSFILRPYEVGSWALLALSCIAASSLLTVYTGIRDPTVPWWITVYFLFTVGVVVVTPLHAGLAFPVVHRLLLRRPRVVWLLYGIGLLQAGFNIAAWYWNYQGQLAYSRELGSAVTLAAVLFFVGRCAKLALKTADPLIAQRARILLVGGVVGLAPFALAQFMQQVFGVLPIDSRFFLWPLAVLVLALGRVTVRQDLMNARIAVRRAVLYAGAVGILTALILVLIAIQPYAVPVLLFPVLYLWPRFEARLNQRLYPQRAHFPELLRTIGAELAASGTVDAALDVLTQAPRRLCDARSSVAFLLPGQVGRGEHVSATDSLHRGENSLADELIVQLLRTTRKELVRDRLAVEPQYSNIIDELYAGFDRLGVELLLPMIHQQSVVGGLAVGRRASGDVYEAAEIDALSTVAQQGVQAVMRVEATERLRSRELEFQDLKRFFPPQIIDQVMARGGAAELRTQRKVVTVLFADLRGFTSFSDTVEPEDVMTTLAEYHAAMGRRIAEFGGTLEHFAGDGFMVFFNDPVDQPDHAARSASMALAMRADVERLHMEWARKGYQMHIGIGIHTGYATCGFIGYEGRRDYAVIGNVTNLAARLSDAATAGEILVSARVRAELGDRYRLEDAGALTLKGFHQTHAAFRLLGPNGGPPDGTRASGVGSRGDSDA